ncbi:MAG TPA: nucleotidyltransferase family protein, partial [Vicinamibacteria bacterium]
MTQEFRWVLARAFGPLPGPGEGLHAGSSGAALARTLDLAPRIATRQERERLVLEVGAEGARALASARGVAAVAADDLLGAALDVRDAARDLGAPVPIVLLKGVALTATGVAVPGSRWLGDVDILCPAWALESLAAALRERGYARVEGVPTCDHQLAPLRGRSGRVVELHRFLPGVRLRGAPGFATAEELAERDLLRSPTGALHGCWVPSRDVLGAHALVHGIAQHGLSPRSYPLMRMLADLVDLGWGAPGHGEAAAAAADLTARHVSRDEREAVLDLCRRLRAGEALPDRLTRRAGPAHRLLGHVLAGSLDPSYSDSLK